MADGNFRFKVNGFDSYTFLLGEEMRGERATLGKSLLQVQKDLKIKAAYVSAIENCDLEAFPNKGFVAGYVRSYARYLNLNPEEVYERFCAESGFSSNEHSRNQYASNIKKSKGLKDYNIETQLDWKPSYVGFEEPNSYIFNRQYLFLAPLLLVFLVLFGISFGAWKVLVDIQKLKIVPADNLPIIMSEMHVSSSDVISEKKVNSYKLDSKNSQVINFDSSVSNKLAPKVIYRDGPIANLQVEDVGVLGQNSLKLDKSLSHLGLSRLQNYAFAKKFDYGVIPEFGVLTFLKNSGENHLNADKRLVTTAIKSTKSKIIRDTLSIEESRLKVSSDANSIERQGGTTLNIFAVNPSWIRIKDEGRKTVVEKILQAGEVLEIESKWFNGNLRAGNAKDLFFSLNGVTYGPVSDKRKVIKNFKIDPQNIFNSLKINDLKDSYLNSFLSKKRSL
jgi:hypothetical protein